MQPPPEPWNEEARADALNRLDILDTSAESAFDDLTRLAALFCGTLFSTVSLIDHERQWFKSIEGPLPITETSREISFCGHAILQQNVFVVEDTKADARFRDNPVVTAGPMIRFYAGAPLITKDNLVLGTLCVFDPKPGALTDNQLEALTLLARQVTERLEQRMATTLIDHLGSLLEVSNSYVVMYDPYREQVNYSNPALNKRLQDRIPANARDLVETLFPDLDYDRYFTPDRLANLQGERSTITRVRFPNDADGKAELRIVPHFRNGRHTCLVLFNDQSELNRTRTLAENAQSNVRVFSKVAAQSKNAVIITGPEGLIQWVNQSFERMSGYTSAEAEGRHPGQLLQGPDTSPQDRERISKHLREGKPVVQEILNYTKTGDTYWVELYIEPIRDDHQRITHFAASQRNVTQQKEQEQAIRAARAAAERANRAKSQFLANISHELRTPLNGIMAVSEHLLEQVPAELKDSAETLDRSSRHLLTLLNDLIDLSQIESNQLTLQAEPFHLADLLRDIEQLFRSRAGAVGTDLRVDMSGIGKRSFTGDATRLKQVLINLVNNAVKFTQGGQIVIRARLEGDDTRDDGTIESRLHLAVADTGPGISREHQQRIFQSFEQLDNSTTRVHGGSGLGLAISQQIIKAMDSEILLDSEPGRGSTFSFTITLPSVTSTTDPETGDQQSMLRAVSHALVVDDNEINRKVLVSLLQRLGFQVVYSAPSARRGLAILDNIHPDLVFVDLHMPTIDGIEFIRLARRHFEEINKAMPPAIACTADVADHQRKHCLESGFDEHLGKPITGAAVMRVLASLKVTPEVAAPAQKRTIEPAAPGAGNGADTESAGRTLLDVDALRQSLMGSEELLNEFLMLLLENLPKHISLARDALNTDTLVENYGAAHSIKGLVGYFASAELVRSVTDLESAMKDGDASTAKSEFARVETMLESLLGEIKGSFPELARGH